MVQIKIEINDNDIKLSATDELLNLIKQLNESIEKQKYIVELLAEEVERR